MSDSVRTGVLLTGFGGPDCLDSVGPFMTKLMHREPTPEMLERARAKYEAIGGCSPLTRIASEIASKLEGALSTDRAVPVRVGMRYWDPYIENAMRELVDAGCTRVVTTSLSPFESKVANGAYREAVAATANEIALADVAETGSLHAAQGFRAFHGAACARALEASSAHRPLLVLTAHSLPLADLSEDDPYVAGLQEVSSAVAISAGLSEGSHFGADAGLVGISAFGDLEATTPWLMAYQSKGMRPGEWLGPDIGDVFAAGAQAGHDGVVVCPIGFATDHMETLYDLDIVGKRYADAAGLSFVRAEVPNASAQLIDAFAGLVRPLL